MRFTANQSLCEGTAFAKDYCGGCCCLPEPSLVVGETLIQRKPLCLGISPGKAQHLLGNQSWAWGCCCCLPERVSAARWMIPAWSEILFALASPLPEREAWLHTSVNAFPRSKCGEGTARLPRGREGALGLEFGKRSGSRIACRGTHSRPVARHVSPAPIRRDGSLPPKGDD